MKRVGTKEVLEPAFMRLICAVFCLFVVLL
jgi:hypothetical protein